MSRIDDRKSARREAYERDREQAERESAGPRGRTILVSAEELDKLGIGEFKARLGEKDREGVFQGRLLPFHPDDPDRLAFPLFIHYGVGPDNDAFLCPVYQGRAMRDLGMPLPAGWDGRCPVCEEHGRALEKYKAEKTGLNEEDRQKAYAPVRALTPHTGSFRDPKPKSMLVWWVDASSRDTEAAGAMAFVMPYQSVYSKGVLEMGRDPATGEFADLCDPKDEMVFYFKRIGKGKEDTEYFGYRAFRKPWTMSAEDVQAVVDSVPALSQVLRFSTYDEIEAALTGAAPADDGGPDDGGQGEREEADRGGRSPRPAYQARGTATGRTSSAAPNESGRPREASPQQHYRDNAPPDPDPDQGGGEPDPMPPARRAATAPARGAAGPTSEARRPAASSDRRPAQAPPPDDDIAVRLAARRKRLQEQAAQRGDGREPRDRREPD